MKRPGNALLAGGLAALVAGMVGVSFAAVPLYRLFCQATGFDGTPQIGASIAPGAAQGTIEVRFDANTSPSLPWNFTADQTVVTVPLGEDRLASYSGRNETSKTITGVATYNISPLKAAHYFHKTACFCFNEQTLKPGKGHQLPPQLLGRSRHSHGPRYARRPQHHPLLHVLSLPR